MKAATTKRHPMIRTEYVICIVHGMWLQSHVISKWPNQMLEMILSQNFLFSSRGTKD